VANSDFAGPALSAVAEEEKQMSYPNKEQIGKVEQELEKARIPQSFRSEKL
jgi:hypothetical protein